MKLIERNIAKIKADARGKKDHFAWDSEMPGFGLRVQNGRASWVMQYQVHGRQHRIKLGDQAVMSADLARSAAKEAAHKVDKSRRTGEAHPILEQKRIADEMARAEAKRPGDAPLGSRIDEYLAARTGNGNGLRESSLTETGATLNNISRHSTKSHWQRFAGSTLPMFSATSSLPPSTIAHVRLSPHSTLGQSGGDGATLAQCSGQQLRDHPETVAPDRLSPG